MSTDLGYKILKGPTPSPESIDAAMDEISAENLQKFRESVSSLSFERLGWGKHCDSLFHDGLDVSFPPSIGGFGLGLIR
jgi:hypothetical protein